MELKTTPTTRCLRTPLFNALVLEITLVAGLESKLGGVDFLVFEISSESFETGGYFLFATAGVNFNCVIWLVSVCITARFVDKDTLIIDGKTNIWKQRIDFFVSIVVGVVADGLAAGLWIDGFVGTDTGDGN